MPLYIVTLGLLILAVGTTLTLSLTDRAPGLCALLIAIALGLLIATVVLRKLEPDVKDGAVSIDDCRPACARVRAATACIASVRARRYVELFAEAH